MGVFAVIEGVDGSGKQTLSEALAKRWAGMGFQVVTEAFPRYGRSIHADLIHEALHGQHGGTSASVYAMGLLYALDRREAASAVRTHTALNDVLLCDRYVAANLAYGAARMREGIDGAVGAWIEELEFGRFQIPAPDLHILLDVPVEVARKRMSNNRALDAFERDFPLQARVAQNYRALAERGWVSPWQVLVSDGEATPEELAAQVVLPRAKG
jgi:dTMP kinase